MELGNAIAIGSLFVTVGGIAIAWICTRAPKQDCLQGELCPEHSGVKVALDNLGTWMKNVSTKLDSIEAHIRGGKGQ